jgi:superfamily II DNA/RNA helicase
VLANQQSDYLRRFFLAKHGSELDRSKFLNVRVKTYTGESTGSLKVNETEHNVLVMTPAVMLDALQRSLLPLSHFRCFILDEV